MTGDRGRCLEALLASGGEPVALFDTAGRVLVAAPALAAALGRTTARLEGRTLKEVGCALIATCLEEGIERSCRQRSVVVIAGPPLAPQRDLVMTPFRDESGRIWAIGAALNGGRYKDEIGRFLSAANHDLRQPFQAMNLFHHLLSGRLADPKLIDLADKLGQSIAAADRGLSELVMAARMDAGLIEPNRRAFPLAMILIPLVEECRSRAKAAGLRFTVHYGPSSGDIEIHSDPGLLETLLRHIVDNAIRFTAKGGVLFGVRSRRKRLFVEVWDSGPGIAASDLAAVWEDFRRAESPPRNGISGMGLGLGIVRRLSCLLDHPVAMNSRQGRGTVITVDVGYGQSEPEG